MTHPTIDQIALGPASRCAEDVTWLLAREIIAQGKRLDALEAAGGRGSCHPTFQSDPEKMCEHELADVRIAGLERLLADCRSMRGALVKQVERSNVDRDEARRERDALQQRLDHVLAHETTELEYTKQQLAASREALAKYGRHLMICEASRRTITGGVCTCGLTAALAPAGDSEGGAA